MLTADAIAKLPADRTSFSPGDEVDVHLLSATVEMVEPEGTANADQIEEKVQESKRA